MIEPDASEVRRFVAEGYEARPAPDPAARARLLDRLDRERLPRRWPTALAWLLRPQSMSWSPFGAAVAAAVLVALGFAVGQWRAIRPLAISAPDAPTPAGEAPAGPQVVQFVLVQPGASRVALVGDFNGWDVDASPMRRDAGGAWSIALPLLPGRHVYAFVVDGRRWVADPVAPLAPEEDFGFHNSVVVVGEQGSI